MYWITFDNVMTDRSPAGLGLDDLITTAILVLVYHVTNLVLKQVFMNKLEGVK